MVAPASLSWVALVDGALDGARNMARDHALAAALAPGSAVLRLYRWERPTLSLGRNEPALGRYDPAAARRLGVDVVRRPTGGRAVLHWRELTYAVVVPVRAFGGPRATYRFLHRILAKGLASLGIPVEIAPDPDRAPPVHGGPCFRDAAGGELVVGGRKLVGSAQLRVGDALLQHGSILLADDQALLSALAPGEDGPPDRPATVSDLLKREPHPGELERALLAAFGVAEACSGAGRSASPIEAELVERYASEAWTWRR